MAIPIGMPVYEYECRSCHKIHELQQKMSDAPLKKCPDCGSSVEKLISRSSFSMGSSSTSSVSSAPQPTVKGCGSGCGHNH
ncbi:MAG: FmdB family zinc ribbon protein [Bacteriovoracia bacterium]